MCPMPEKNNVTLSSQSHVEELKGIPSLFNALTSKKGIHDIWTIFKFPLDFDTISNGVNSFQDVAARFRKYKKLQINQKK